MRKINLRAFDASFALFSDIVLALALQTLAASAAGSTRSEAASLRWKSWNGLAIRPQGFARDRSLRAASIFFLPQLSSPEESFVKGVCIALLCVAYVGHPAAGFLC